MSKERTKEKIAVMQAFVDGRAIEIMILDDPDQLWVRLDSPNFNWEKCNYRIAKQKQKTVKLLAFFTGYQLIWLEETRSAPCDWKRVQSEDKEVEVCDE